MVKIKNTSSKSSSTATKSSGSSNTVKSKSGLSIREINELGRLGIPIDGGRTSASSLLGTKMTPQELVMNYKHRVKRRFPDITMQDLLNAPYATKNGEVRGLTYELLLMTSGIVKKQTRSMLSGMIPGFRDFAMHDVARTENDRIKAIGAQEYLDEWLDDIDYSRVIDPD
jgi:hypothetical protein